MTLSIDLIPQHLIQNETGTTSSEGMFEEENNMSELEFVMEELPQTSEPENDVQLIMDKSGAIGCQSQFDEFEFRQRCKTAQSEICFELKCIVDEIYDSLDKHVAAVSDGIGQSQAILMREFEGQIESIRALTHKSEIEEKSNLKFLSNIENAYRSAFDGEG